MKEPLSFPDWDIPDADPKPVSPAAFHLWATHNFIWMSKAGLVGRIVNQPRRQPAKARFVLR